MARIFIWLIYSYQWVISPFKQPRCRYPISCSRYAIHVLDYYGFFKGCFLILKRLLKCHPYTKNIES